MISSYDDIMGTISIVEPAKSVVKTTTGHLILTLNELKAELTIEQASLIGTIDSTITKLQAALAILRTESKFPCQGLMIKLNF